MNRYQEQLDAFEPSEGFQGRLSENVISYIPNMKKIYHPRATLRTLMLIILITIALAITASAAYIALNWDPIFVKRFFPTEKQTAQLDNAAQNDSIISKCGDVTLKVRQTLGDDKTLYIILDITLPESVPLSDLIVTDASGEKNLNIIPFNFLVGSNVLTYDDVKGINFEDHKAVNDLLGSFEGSCSCSEEAVDYSTNTLTYLLCCSPQTMTVSGKPLTILIDKLVQTSEQPFKTILEGPFLISWTPTCGAVSRTYEIKEGSYIRGSVTISPFTLKGELYKTDFANFDEMFHSISLSFRNGETYMPEHEGCGGSYSSPSGACSFDTQFTKILLLDDVVSIHMGGYTIECRGDGSPVTPCQARFISVWY
jgi:hypothetical protein